MSGRGHFQRLRLRLFPFLSSRKRTPQRKSTTSERHLVAINQPFYIAVRHNDFEATTVPYFNVCFVVIHVRLHFETPGNVDVDVGYNYDLLFLKITEVHS